MCDSVSFLLEVYENDCFLSIKYVCHVFKIKSIPGWITEYIGCHVLTCHGWEIKQEIPPVNLIRN